MELGKWINKNTPPDSGVFVNDAGAIRYFGNRKTIDLLGLNNHELLFDKETRVGIYLRPEAMKRRMKKERANYLIIFPAWFLQLVQSDIFKHDFIPIYSRRSKNYTICDAAQDNMVVFSLK